MDRYDQNTKHMKFLKNKLKIFKRKPAKLFPKVVLEFYITTLWLSKLLHPNTTCYVIIFFA